MKLVKTQWAPRTIRIEPDDYIRMYPDCSTPRRLNLLFSRAAKSLMLDDPIADFLIGKYEGLEIYEPEATPAVPQPEPEQPLEEPIPEPEPEPEIDPLDVAPVIDPDDYVPKVEVKDEPLPDIPHVRKKRRTQNND